MPWLLCQEESAGHRCQVSGVGLHGLGTGGEEDGSHVAASGGTLEGNADMLLLNTSCHAFTLYAIISLGSSGGAGYSSNNLNSGDNPVWTLARQIWLAPPSWLGFPA
jgi:hypothetical protein